MKELNKKKLIGAILIVIIVTVSIGTYWFFQGQPQPLKYDCTLIKSSDSYTLHMNLYTERALFRCVLNIRYLANDGTWLTISDEQGVVDMNPIHGGSFSLDNYQPGQDIDFEYFSEGMEVFYFNETTPLETMKIDAYGYRNP
jgi:hypothetical protein